MLWFRWFSFSFRAPHLRRRTFRCFTGQPFSPEGVRLQRLEVRSCGIGIKTISLQILVANYLFFDVFFFVTFVCWCSFAMMFLVASLFWIVDSWGFCNPVKWWDRRIFKTNNFRANSPKKKHHGKPIHLLLKGYPWPLSMPDGNFAAGTRAVWNTGWVAKKKLTHSS